MRTSVVLEVNKTGIVCYVCIANGVKGELNPCGKMDSDEGLLGQPLSTKDNIEVFPFPCKKHFAIVVSHFFQNTFEMLVKCFGSGLA